MSPCRGYGYIGMNLYVGSHVVAGLVLPQRRDAARVEDILSDKRTRQCPDKTFLVGRGGR